jgi:hypothetical protein
MYRRVLWGVSALMLLGGSIACVEQGELPGPPYDVIVLDRVDDSSSPDDFSFALQRRTLETVSDFERLAAPSFRIRQGGTLTAEEVDGDTVVSGSFEGDDAPHLRYVVEDGAAVPRDYATLLMFSAAYQFERVLGRLGVVSDPSLVAMLGSRGALDVIFGPVMLTRSGGAQGSLRLDTNAFFFPEGWQFGLARSSERERVPLAADARVIAHELGHAIFDLAFFGGVREPCDREEAASNEQDPWFPGRLPLDLTINGLNEGFADWISFAVSGGADPIASIVVPGNDELDVDVPRRLLTEDNFRWSQIDKFDERSDDTRCRGPYCIGTLFARSLVAAYIDAGNAPGDETARQAFSRGVVVALQGTEARMRERELPLPHPAVARCRRQRDVSPVDDPPIIGAFLEAFLAGFPEAQAASLCPQLADRFEDGFPSEFRRGCEQ